MRCPFADVFQPARNLLKQGLVVLVGSDQADYVAGLASANREVPAAGLRGRSASPRGEGLSA